MALQCSTPARGPALKLLTVALAVVLCVFSLLCYVHSARDLPLHLSDPRAGMSEARVDMSWLRSVPQREPPPWPEYPRPGLRRDAWLNLNGNWSYEVTRLAGGRGSRAPPFASREAGGALARGLVVVPFAVESSLSGVGWRLKPDEVLWYERIVPLQPVADRRYLLHFEAVDYSCAVAVNGLEVGGHTGGSTPFTFEVTQAVRAGDNLIAVRVVDETGLFQLTGKQTPTPRGIWYSRSSGIRGTVWLEDVPRAFVRDLRITPRLVAPRASEAPLQLPGPAIDVEVDVARPPSGQVAVQVAVLNGSQEVASKLCEPAACELHVRGARLWTPDDPFLYDLRVELRLDGKVVDAVRSYTGIRTVGKKRDSRGNYRFTLNGEFIFHWGTLDQGWWPRGGLTPDSDGDMLADITFLKAAGFNTIRKHVKVEPRRYYYHCDRVGMLVWQDQVATAGCQSRRVKCGPNDPLVSPRWEKRLEMNGWEAEWPDDAHRQYMAEFSEMIDTLQNSPSVVVWTPFNEAWGQHRTMEVGRWVQQRDASRLVNIASGGNFFPVGDIVDQHSYPQPRFDGSRELFRDYVRVVGEFGGFKQGVKGHSRTTGKVWGYDDGTQPLLERFREALNRTAELAREGVAGAVYTQTTDVEGEINGLLTYDRQVQKLSSAQLRQALADSGLVRAGW